MNERRGFVVILSAPSGCGKTTILNRLIRRHPDWIRSVSVTTRLPRPGEKEGKDYEFVSTRTFQSLRRRGEFLESARVFNQFYGTRKSAVEEGVGKVRIVILAIDVHGARSIRRRLRGKVPLLSIFILPPSMAVLRERLSRRGTDSRGEIEKRIRRAELEIKRAREYDSTIVNLDLSETVHRIETYIKNFEKKRR